MKLSHIPLRLTTGAYILNSGLNKRNLDADAAAGLQHLAGNAFPQVLDLEPVRFGKLLSAAEITLGLFLLTPFVPSRLAGLALGVFSGGMVTMYLKTPDFTEDDGFRPSSAGVPFAKDIWLAGIAAALILDTKNKTKVKVVKVPTPVKTAAAAAVVKAAKDAKDSRSHSHSKDKGKGKGK
ncbi:hypothetical protein [Arthrobacter gallicola]|uniref:hypothetical protein n=1 Tax=Arthrobacter gallicola TaxID=2762225 RepID=UPI00296A9111|nr:hypothetical protein [Arthrobacter gallicola]